MNETDLTRLENRVEELLKWKRERSSERLRLPLDFATKTALHKRDLVKNNIPIATGNTPTATVGLITDFLSYGAYTNLRGKRRLLYIALPLRACTANDVTDFITNTTGQHNLKAGDQVAFTTSGTLPAGLDEIRGYYIINPTGSTFQVSTSSGGAAANITDTGTGIHYFALIR